jgi:nucleotide-binding universal stress UspA family protein
MFKHIYIPVDNSDHSNTCIELALELAKGGETKVTASHVYAAKMHDVRFRQMESGLPEEYQDEEELEKQRNIHDQLITKGMEVITDSYLDVPRFKCRDAGVPFIGKSLEGRNWIELVRDIRETDYDLVIMGALGLGAIRDSQLGTVCERVIRRISTDALIIKYLPEIHGERPSSGKIVVSVDGSGHSFGGLRTGIELAKKLNRPLEVISTFDPYFHYAMFNSLTGVLSKEAGKVFKFEQQEKLHEDIIDKGLAKIYQAHLEISRKIVQDEGLDCTVRLLDGKVFEKVLQYAREENPYLLILGRIGVHSAADMDIGGNTENLLRLVPCNVLLSSKVYKPPIDMLAEETIEWTAEAKLRLKKIPGFVLPMATSAILRYALERGHSMITSSIITEAVQAILPAGAMQAMQAVGEKIRQAETSGEDSGVTLHSLKDEMYNAHAGKKKEDVRLQCGDCGAVMGGDAVTCGVCTAGLDRLLPVDHDGFKTNADNEGGVRTMTSFDSVQMQWTEEALDLLKAYPEGHIRRKAQARVEKMARVQKIVTISLAFANMALNEKTTARGKLAESEAESKSNGRTTANPAYSPNEVDPDGFTWEKKATERLELIPAGFMRDMTRKRVLDYASSIEATHITFEVCQSGIDISKKMMEDAIRNGATLEDFLPKKTAV